MKQIFKPLAILLAAVMLLAGCQTADTTWVFRHGEETMPAGVYISLMMDSYSDAVDKLQEIQDAEVAALTESLGEDAVLEEEPTYIEDLPINDVYKMELEGVPVSQWMIGRTQELAREYFAVQGKMTELGVTLSEDQIKAAADSASQYVREAQEFYDTNGISEKSINLLILNTLSVEALFQALYGEGGLYGVTEAEMKAFYAQQYSKTRYMIVAKVTADDLSEEEAAADEAAQTALLEQRNAERKAQAEGYLERLKNGEPIEDLQYEWDLAVAKAQAEASGEELGEVGKVTADQMTFIMDADYRDYYDEAFFGAFFDTPAGESVLVEDDYSFYLVQGLDILEDNPEDFASMKESILREMRYESDFLPKIEEWAAGVELTVNQASIDRYVPSKIKSM